MEQFVFNLEALVSFIAVLIKELSDINATKIEVIIYEEAVKKEVVGTYRRKRVLKGFLGSCERLNIAPEIARFESRHSSYGNCLYMVNYVSNQEKKSMAVLKQGSNIVVFDDRLTDRNSEVIIQKYI
ncbi:hypothetical protein [Brevibacillus nitrificans]|uniref:hypothetical protein n=1 Tax=Brevibacillus nitrificans TaxID=651560 RepID=UPI0028646A75|nr:hypothetical protein [Brevibacillus nitrificans]MDR7314901.1 hypothetical protein [Brevibacillus nitrificans]